MISRAGRLGRASETQTWQALLNAYQFSKTEALEYKKNPIDVLALLQEQVPLLHLISLNDKVVPAKKYLRFGNGIVNLVERLR